MAAAVRGTGSKLWCSDLAIDNALWGETSGENWERNSRILTSNELEITFWVPDGGAKFHSENLKIASLRP